MIVLGIERSLLLQQELVSNVHVSGFGGSRANLAVEHLAAGVHEVRSAYRWLNGLHTSAESIVAIGVGWRFGTRTRRRGRLDSHQLLLEVVYVSCVAAALCLTSHRTGRVVREIHRIVGEGVEFVPYRI